ncbi:nitrogenase iron-molybdenum cofactor biosynthesis protein NifN [Thiothrix nivea]|uniref:Nitrogenase iron-molybdenum cofactor biosynthesis protein NifN n=1 Tax=Thiothrix nivea (strain ATCC 35100 / DSM 5205 / JP2) TaxID=870187 RepID=A0A656HLV2_THINJ|nr:nitrogenase iron-molybdenum cofactor biosynthesis protein NifN [Thiothrix nivea]EIJ35995.1 nitrogenase molybdenum-iron cofactor biosynthesis protein NifN [Thiothrix nivea DSM 5205]
MPEVTKRKKALSVSPLKASQTIGAALAFLGFHRAMPMLHGAQGCTAFGKVFFVRHFREPIPLQTTAMDQIAAVMGSDENVVEGLKAICSKNSPSLVGVPTTGLAETQGSDVTMAVGEFRKKYPEYNHIPVVPLSTPDFSGCLETGFAKAVEGVINVLVPDAETAGTKPGKRPRQLNVLVNSSLTPGDLEALKDIIELCGFRPLIMPDLSDSLDGHVTDADFSPLTIGGTLVSEMATLGDSKATLVIGASLNAAADLLKERTGVPDYRFDHLMGLEANDVFIDTLHQLSGEPVPQKLQRQRAQLQDAMLDTHFMLGLSRFAIAADPDLLNGFSHLLAENGAYTVAAVAPANAPAIKKIVTEHVHIGDLEDLEKAAEANEAEVLICNSHGQETALRLGIPLLRAGFPQYDLVGGYQRQWIGYAGTRQTLFDLANILLSLEKGEIHPYHSIYAQKRDDEITHFGKSLSVTQH